MEVNVHLYSAAQLRLFSRFANEMADLAETEESNARKVGMNAALGAEYGNAQTAPEPTGDSKPAAEQAKRTRKPKEEPAKKEDAQTAPTQPTAEAGADAAPETKAEPSEPDFDDAPQAPVDDLKVSHDDLRKVFGELSQNGKRDAAIKVVRDEGYNAIKDIADDKLYPIYAKLKAL